MRKGIIAALAAAAVLLVFLGYLLGVKSGNSRTNRVYPRTTKVICIDTDADLVCCLDDVGQVWAFHGAEDWDVGDCATLLMDDNGTQNIYDDGIIMARYNAWLLR